MYVFGINKHVTFKYIVEGNAWNQLKYLVDYLSPLGFPSPMIITLSVGGIGGVEGWGWAKLDRNQLAKKLEETMV